MAYNNAIPQAADIPANSQVSLLNNFIAIKAGWDINHVELNAAGAGKHNYVSMPRQAADPAGLALEATLFSKLSAVTGATELAWKRDAAATAIEFTGAGGADGWTRLPSGILIKWGSGVTAAGLGTITYNAAVNFAALYSLVLSPWGSLASDIDLFIRVKDLNPGGGTPVLTSTVWGSQRTKVVNKVVPFYYLAIGV